MKKIIALMLVVFTLSALFVSCANDTNNPEITTPDPGTDPNGTPIEGFTSVNETVYVIAESGLNVRSTPNADTEDNKVGSLAYGKDVTRTGVNETTDWSRIMYNNDVAFVKSEFLSTTKPDDIVTDATDTDVADDKFTACADDTFVYTTVVEEGKDVHKEGADSAVYSAPNKSKGAGSLKDGTAVKRVAVYYEKEDDHTYGWSKIEVTADGETKTYFIRNSQLKIEMVKDAAAQ